MCILSDAYSDSKFFHITPKFYVYLTTAPGGKKWNIVLSWKPIVTMVARLTSSTTKIRKESEKNEHIFHYLYGILAQIYIVIEAAGWADKSGRFA